MSKSTVVVPAVALLALAAAGVVLAWPPTGGIVPVPTPSPSFISAPNPPEPPIDGDWLPKAPKPGTPPTAFPKLLPVGKREIAEACPHLFGKDAITIDPADDTYRRLLKARLYQGTLQLATNRKRIQIGQYVSTEFPSILMCMNEMRAGVIELWANDPKNLIPRLEELVVLAKEWQRLTEARVEAGTDPPQQLPEVQGHRLTNEIALWKAVHGKLGGR